MCLHIYVIVGIQLTQPQDVVGIQHTLKQRNLESNSGYADVRWIPSRLFGGQVGFQLTPRSSGWIPTHVVIVSWIPTHVVIVKLDSNLFLCLHIYVTVGIQLTQCRDVVGIQHTPKQRGLESNSGYGGVRWIPSRLFGGQVGFQITF